MIMVSKLFMKCNYVNNDEYDDDNDEDADDDEDLCNHFTIIFTH